MSLSFIFIARQITIFLRKAQLVKFCRAPNFTLFSGSGFNSQAFSITVRCIDTKAKSSEARHGALSRREGTRVPTAPNWAFLSLFPDLKSIKPILVLIQPSASMRCRHQQRWFCHGRETIDVLRLPGCALISGLHLAFRAFRFEIACLIRLIFFRNVKEAEGIRLRLFITDLVIVWFPPKWTLLWGSVWRLKILVAH